MSGHSPEQEAATYAGQANMGGVESLDRSTFRKVSEIFNAFVFGSEAPAPTPAPAQAPAPLPSLSATSEAASTAPQAREAATVLAALADFPSHNSSDPMNDSSLAPTLLGDDGVYGLDLIESSANHAPCPCAPRGGISPDCLSSIQKRITKAVEMMQVVLLHQKPGFGKTMTIFKLLREGYFCVIFVPTNPLKDQVRLKFDSEFVCAV